MHTHAHTLSHTHTYTHLRNTVIDSIWTFACLATPQVSTNKNTQYRRIPKNPLPKTSSLPLLVVSQLIVSSVLSCIGEITAGRGTAFTTGNGPPGSLLLVPSIRLIRVDSTGLWLRLHTHIKHTGRRRVWMDMKWKTALASRFPPITASCLMFRLSSKFSFQVLVPEFQP